MALSISENGNRQGKLFINIPICFLKFRYIITCTDYYSKWVEAAALPTKDAAGPANFLYTLFCWHGIPKKIQTDQGKEFVSHHLFQLTGVKHVISSAYHPQTNGLDERFNQTLQWSLLYRDGWKKLMKIDGKAIENLFSSLFVLASKTLPNILPFLLYMGGSLDFQ